MKALILDNKVVDISETEFEVHESMTWMDCPGESETGKWKLLEGTLQAIPEPEDTRTYADFRREEYGLLNQDEMRYDDVKNSTTTWVDAIDAIKLQFPKG